MGEGASSKASYVRAHWTSSARVYDAANADKPQRLTYGVLGSRWWSAPSSLLDRDTDTPHRPPVRASDLALARPSLHPYILNDYRTSAGWAVCLQDISHTHTATAPSSTMQGVSAALYSAQRFWNWQHNTTPRLSLNALPADLLFEITSYLNTLSDILQLSLVVGLPLALSG